MTAADVHAPRALPIVVGVAIAVCAAILWLTRTYTFYFDEWTFITTAPGWTPVTFFTPHNEHPSMLFRLLYWVLLNSVGLRSYLPYMATLLLAHLANVVLVFELVRRRAGDLIGLAAALLLAVLGAGWENVLWAFQVSLDASVALGLAALLAAQDARRMPVSTALILASLGFSGTGLLFAIALGVQLLLTSGRRRQLWWLVAVGVLVVAWYVAFGRFGAQPNPPPTIANLLVDPVYALWGMTQSIGGLIGESGWVGAALMVAGLAAIGWSWWRRRPDPFALGVGAGLVSFYLLTGAIRAQLGWQQSGVARYVYIGAVLWLLLLADPARDLPWRGTWRPALTALLFLACFNSAVLLFEFATAKTVQMEREVADLQALAAERGDPCLDPDGHPDLLVMPQLTPRLYYGAVEAYGDPVAGLPVRDRADFDTARSNIRKAGC